MNLNSTEQQKKQKAKSDLTPGIGNKPPRRSYWAEAITIRHENFHISDWRDSYHKPAILRAQTDIEKETVDVTPSNLDPAKVLAGKDSSFTKVVDDETMDARDEFNKESEKRAYDDGASDYRTLADSIQP